MLEANLDELEAYWHDRPVDGILPGCLSWLPYPMGQFQRDLDVAAGIAPSAATFLDVGCGIGTKALEASRHGFRAAGLGMVPAYLAVARSLGVPVFRADARTWNGYDLPDVIYLNGVLTDAGAEALLERRVQGQMRSGAVLIAVNSESPPADGWDRVAVLEPYHDVIAVKR